MVRLAEGSRAGSYTPEAVGAPADLGHGARPAGLDGHQDAIPARASAARAPIAAGATLESGARGAGDAAHEDGLRGGTGAESGPRGAPGGTESHEPVGGPEAAAMLQRIWRRHSSRLREVRGEHGEYIGSVHAALSSRLMRHQRAGVEFLCHSFLSGGGILGDEPGLGKTVQAIASIELLVAAGEVSRVLVVVPASLVQHWASEFQRWLGRFGRCLTVSPIKADTAALHATYKLEQMVATRSPAHAIVIASYETVHQHGAVLQAGRGVDLIIIFGLIFGLIC